MLVEKINVNQIIFFFFYFVLCNFYPKLCCNFIFFGRGSKFVYLLIKKKIQVLVEAAKVYKSTLYIVKTILSEMDKNSNYTEGKFFYKK